MLQALSEAYHAIAFGPIIIVLSFIIAIASFVIGIYLNAAQKKEKEITIFIDANDLIIVPRDYENRIMLSYNNRKVHALIEARIRIANTGNIIIREADLIDSNPIRLSINDKDSIILDGSIREREQFIQDHRIEWSNNDGTVDFYFCYLEPGEYIEIMIIYSGMGMLTGSGKIIGGEVKCMYPRPSYYPYQRDTPIYYDNYTFISRKKGPAYWLRIGVSFIILALMVWFVITFFKTDAYQSQFSSIPFWHILIAIAGVIIPISIWNIFTSRTFISKIRKIHKKNK